MDRQRTSGEAAPYASLRKEPGEEELHALYADVFRRLPRGIVILQSEEPRNARALRIVELNATAARVVGESVDAMKGKALGDFPELLKTPFPEECLASIESAEAKNLGDVPCQSAGGTREIYAVQVVPLPGSRVCAVFENVTKRRQEEHKLRENEERFRLFVQGVEEYAMFQLDPQGRVVSWNKGAKRLKGYGTEEIIGKHFSVFYAPEDVKSGRPWLLLKQAGERGQVEDEGWRVRKDGSRFWANVVVTALRDASGVLRGYAKVTRDLTERHRKEEMLVRTNELLERRAEQRAEVLARVNSELRSEIAERQHVEQQLRTSLDELRALAGRLQNVREEERAFIAREIHDELGQACTAAKMDLVLIAKKTTKHQGKLREKINSTIRLVDEMIATQRRIASQLRPRTLDDLGLNAALEWQAQEFESRTGIACRLTLPDERLVLDTERSIAIFRIFQESLTNVVRHAAATRVEAHLEITASKLIFRIRDNGKGFEPESTKAHGSLGLVGMQERAILLNGELKIESAPDAGTTLTLNIPLPSPPSKAQA